MKIRSDIESNSTVQSRTAEYSTGRADAEQQHSTEPDGRVQYRTSREGDWSWIKDKNLPKECTGSLVTCIRPGHVEKHGTKRISR